MEQKKSMELDLWSFNKIQKIICFLLFSFLGIEGYGVLCNFHQYLFQLYRGDQFYW
jgi:hypothetical protein